MPVIGITGGIATGKSLVTRLFQEQGAVVFSADEAARAVLSPDSPTLREIARAFGSAILLPDGSLNRALLGSRVVADPDARARLNAITHPPVLRLLRAQIEAARADSPPGTVIAVEVPLLFETHLQDWFDYTIVVSASEALQIARLQTRRSLTEEDARRWIAAQWPLSEKIARADFVIENNGTMVEVRAQVAACWKRLLAGR